MPIHADLEAVGRSAAASPRPAPPMPFARRRKPDPSVRRRVRRAVAPAAGAPPAVAAAAAAPRDRRLVSGPRVLCRCSLELPKLDAFSTYRAAREGFMVLNVRGGSLYLAHQFTEEGARRAFPDGSALALKRFTLYPPDGGEPVVIGTLGVRFLKLVRGRRLDGLVLRFTGLDDRQIDLLGGLAQRCPTVDGDEEAAVPREALLGL